jgi:hypothetical protein
VALIVEDGSGLPDSESYCSVAYADTRHSNLGNTAWAALQTADKEAALRRATNYMLQVYRECWTGDRVKVDPMQALDWPRYGVEVDHFPVHFDIVPADVANACADLALKASAADLAADLTTMVIREKVGPIETEYARGSPQFTRYVAVERMLSPYLNSTAGMARLVRS